MEHPTGMHTIPSTTVDHDLATRLQAGERIWMARDRRNLVAACYLSALGIALFLLICLQAPGVKLLTPSMVVAIGLAALLWLRVWVGLLVTRLRFTETTIETPGPIWGLFQHRLPLQDIIGARIVTAPKLRAYWVWICQFTPARRRPSRWMAVWATPCAPLKANALLTELRRRCELTEVSPASDDYHTTVWQRTGVDPNLLALKWWQK